MERSGGPGRVRLSPPTPALGLDLGPGTLLVDDGRHGRGPPPAARRDRGGGRRARPLEPAPRRPAPADGRQRDAGHPSGGGRVHAGRCRGRCRVDPLPRPRRGGGAGSLRRSRSARPTSTRPAFRGHAAGDAWESPDFESCARTAWRSRFAAGWEASAFADGSAEARTSTASEEVEMRALVLERARAAGARPGRSLRDSAGPGAGPRRAAPAGRRLRRLPHRPPDRRGRPGGAPAADRPRPPGRRPGRGGRAGRRPAGRSATGPRSAGWPARAATCAACRAAARTSARAADFTGWDRDGGFAERVTVRADVRAARPRRGFDDLAAAPLLCGGVIGYRSLRRGGDPSPAAGWACTASAPRRRWRSRSPATGAARSTSRPARERERRAGPGAGAASVGGYDDAAAGAARRGRHVRPGRRGRRRRPARASTAAAPWRSTRSTSTGSRRSPTTTCGGSASLRSVANFTRADARAVPRPRRGDPHPDRDRGAAARGRHRRPRAGWRPASSPATAVLVP